MTVINDRITRFITRHLAPLAAGLALLACDSPLYKAVAQLEDGLVVTLSARPLFGFHSDWSRSITVSKAGAEIHDDLIEDTGWWRGSNLYRHVSGTYVIHEGQIGCFAFTVEPLAFVSADISCQKDPAAASTKGNASRYYADMVYLGQFAEFHASDAASPIGFIPANLAPEPELPEPF